MKPWVTHCSEEFAQSVVPGPDTVCVSITGVGEADLSKNFEEILRLEFDDVERDYQGYVTMNPGQAAKLARFLEKVRGKNIFVHCAAGISRSSAVATVVLQAFPEYEDKGWNMTGDKSIRHPNGVVTALLKRALGLVPDGA